MANEHGEAQQRGLWPTDPEKCDVHVCLRQWRSILSPIEKDYSEAILVSVLCFPIIIDPARRVQGKKNNTDRETLDISLDPRNYFKTYRTVYTCSCAQRLHMFRQGPSKVSQANCITCF